MKNQTTILLSRKFLRRIAALFGLLSLVVISAIAAGWFASSTSVSIKQVSRPSLNVNSESNPVEIKQSSQTITSVSALNGTIYIQPAELDLGQVEKGTTVKATVRLVNETPNPITISEVITSCGCTVIDTPAPEYAIQSGDSVELSLQLEMPKRANRRLRSNITLLFDGEHEPVELRVLGESVEIVIHNE